MLKFLISQFLISQVLKFLISQVLKFLILPNGIEVKLILLAWEGVTKEMFFVGGY